jgi:ATP phosphoribosyltransferase regulatory subunit
MTENILPTGFYDLIGADAEIKRKITNALAKLFHANGYLLVNPSTMEFERNLFSKEDEVLKKNSFHVIDPYSKEMLAICPDITLQISRIVTNVTRTHSLPLRLAYVGDVFRVKTSSLQDNRRVTQAGIEIVGCDKLEADIEVLNIIVTSLNQLKIGDYVLNFNLPDLLSIFAEKAKLTADSVKEMREAVNNKDISSLKALFSKQKAVQELILPFEYDTKLLKRLVASLKLPKAAKLLFTRLDKLIAELLCHNPKLKIIIDPLAQSNFEYHSDWSFSVVSTVSDVVLARGGRYSLQKQNDVKDAVGASFYVDQLFNLKNNKADLAKRILVDFDLKQDKIEELQKKGYATVRSLGSAKDAQREAVKLDCSHVLSKNKITKIS